MLVVYGSAWRWRRRWSTELNGGMWKPNLTVSINTCSRVVRERFNLRSESGTSSLFNTACPISSMDLTVTKCERWVVVIDEAGCSPSFTSELRRDLILSAISYCEHEKAYQSPWPFTHQCVAWGWPGDGVCWPAFDPWKLRMSHPEVNRLINRCQSVLCSAYLVHNVEFGSRRLIPTTTKFAWIWSPLWHFDTFFL